MEELEKYVEDKATQYIVVNLGIEHYGIDIKYIDNIVKVPAIRRVPNIEEFFKGVINLRGEVIPVMDLRLRFGMEEIEYTGKTRIIIVKLDPQAAIGLIVDEVEQVLDIYDSQIEKVSAEKKEETNGYITTVGKTDRGLVSILNLATVIGEREQQI
ncbi:MAG: purine-binding chemotaxis protein CheW [Lachnospiraceae bacterium]|nr:purine-binding chemotaxis protein CheW [Lachnospiraceae bacterium]MBQ2452864.1 purine-binding chemotaxis protein CheW [Lachnospiraceae bacterium]MBQ4243152.1 purine-binding chemotaxis protein CheW [Lachnospiraceae bacterium]MBQ5534241.1 purine-binding chemotaxis protein CheW [Lachnospiraceae bacterium]MCR4785905.1 chemotaxis protein CheW [Lachnospiraceae bacterium]